MTLTAGHPSTHRFPIHGWAGLVLIAAFWALNWMLPGLRTHILFFPLWLGYILTVDGLVFRRRGDSLLTRSRRDFALLFAVSAPAWWIFEVINEHTENWVYLGAEFFSDLEYFVLCTIAFSTVMPAVFETAELVRSFDWVERWRSGARIAASRKTANGFFAAGVAGAILMAIWPSVFYPLMWGVVFGFIEPINIWTGRPSLFTHLSEGDWRPAISLALGAVICGFFWEFWNWHSYPQWTYRTPGVEFWHVFEMPLLGYIGYLPFGLELYALGHLVRGERLNVRL